MFYIFISHWQTVSLLLPLLFSFINPLSSIFFKYTVGFLTFFYIPHSWFPCSCPAASFLITLLSFWQEADSVVGFGRELFGWSLSGSGPSLSSAALSCTLNATHKTNLSEELFGPRQREAISALPLPHQKHILFCLWETSIDSHRVWTQTMNPAALNTNNRPNRNLTAQCLQRVAQCLPADNTEEFHFFF